ncbi:BMP family ABC transporter substrate-binding protein [Amycolatopsis sp. WAC 01375]|uniref:BMP family ABC transporter substrate-binding protein n=1 Tax=Amycolatopsis sp. WAC 01375 TaxID=2203194 RepID=UPI0013152B45|nr:BMP family ABC transporter substrate-binding protein [Amycolatopsis sp. WAC 01375]
MRKILLSGMVVAVVVMASGCGASPLAESGAAPRVAAIMTGEDTDNGFAQAGADAVKTLTAEGVVAGKTQDGVDVTKAKTYLRQYADSGVDLVIAWGLDLQESVREVASEYPGTKFLGTGGEPDLRKATANVEMWTYDTGQFGYLLGYIAGLTQLSPVAIVDGPQEPFLESQWHGFDQGLKAANPRVTLLSPIYTGDFNDPEKARQATQQQVTAGARLIASNAQGYAPGVAAAAHRAKIATVGISKNASAEAPAVNVAQVKLDMVPIFRAVFARLKSGVFGNQGTTSTIANRSLVVTDVNRVEAAPATPADLVQQATGLADRLASGQVNIVPWSR